MKARLIVNSMTIPLTESTISGVLLLQDNSQLDIHTFRTLRRNPGACIATDNKKMLCGFLNVSTAEPAISMMMNCGKVSHKRMSTRVVQCKKERTFSCTHRPKCYIEM